MPTVWRNGTLVMLPTVLAIGLLLTSTLADDRGRVLSPATATATAPGAVPMDVAGTMESPWDYLRSKYDVDVVYIREAHAIDSRSPMGGGGMPIVEDPVTLAERSEGARVGMTRLALEPMPALVDTLDDAVNTAYAAWPDRLYLIGRDGRIAYHGGPGPFEFEPDELEDAIRKTLASD